MEPLRTRPVLADERSIRSSSASRRPGAEEHLGDAGAGEGVDEAEEHEADKTHMTSDRRRWTSISRSPSVGVEGDEDEVDELDEDERHDDPADAVDPDVAPQDRRRADAAGTSRRAAPAGSARRS